MKKILLIICSILLISGCSDSKKDPINEFEKKVDSLKTYKLVGTMELNNDEETFNYNIEISYLKDDYYKVDMINTQNNHNQVILKNDDGLYVITPSLNKSFKFESNWPNNASQSYILESLKNDVKKDKKAEVLDEYTIKSSVSYPNNPDLSYQKIYLNNDYMVKKVEVFSESDMSKIVVEFNEIDINPKLKKSDFNLDNYIKEEPCEDDDCSNQTTFGSIENAIYPLYMPVNTYLSSSDVVNSDNDSRIILTFSGDKNFTIVEQMANISEEHEIIPVYGEPIMLNDTIAVLSDSSMYWTSNSIDYYLVSEDLTSSEMVFVASSLGNYSNVMMTK